MITSLSAAIRLGLRESDFVTGVHVSEQIEIDGEAAWIFPVTITIDQENQYISRRSSWYVRVSQDYPNGAIDVLPAASDSLTVTFQHQNANLENENGRPWRDGRLCVDYDGRLLFGEAALLQPSSAERRLSWHLERARAWLHAAAKGTLVAVGDPFESPAIRRVSDSPSVVYNEDVKTFESWKGSLKNPISYGECNLRATSNGICATASFDDKKRVISETSWGTVFSTTGPRAAWLLLNELPIVAPFGFPATWGDLRSILKARGVSLNNTLRRLASHLRLDREAILMIGFPIPLTIGGAPVEIAWEAVRVPELTMRTAKVKREEILWDIDCSRYFRDYDNIAWLNSANVAESHVSMRGTTTDDMMSSNIVLIGCGSLGSAIAEILVRKGITRLTLIDGELFRQENLRRHILDLSAVGKKKAEALKYKFAASSFKLTVTAIPVEFVPHAIFADILRKADVVIDCTAEDGVLKNLMNTECGERCVLFSFGMSAYAKDLYAYRSRVNTFDFEHFSRQFQESRQNDAHGVLAETSVRYAGCQNPSFPASWDHVLELAARATAFLEAHLLSDELIRGERISRVNVLSVIGDV